MGKDIEWVGGDGSIPPYPLVVDGRTVVLVLLLLLKIIINNNKYQ